MSSTRVALFCCAFALLLGACSDDSTLSIDQEPDQGTSNNSTDTTDQGATPDLPAPQDMNSTPDIPTPDPDIPAPQDTGTPDLGTPDTGNPNHTGCGTPAPSQDMEWSVTHDGLTRTFFVHIPPSYNVNQPMPVVLDFHGRALNATAQQGISRMIEVSDAQGFIVVQPEGTGTLQTWNADLCCGHASTNNIDDTGFVEVMLDKLNEDLCVNTRKVYATGLSNGGFMSHKLACELSDRITAIAPVSGTLTTFDCEPARPVPVFHFHGDADTIVPYDGFAGFISVADTIDAWVEINGCNSQPEVFFDQDDVQCERWSDCQQDTEVRLCTVRGGGHTWPGGTSFGLFGHITDTISASEMMWDFFQRYSLP